MKPIKWAALGLFIVGGGAFLAERGEWSIGMAVVVMIWTAGAAALAVDLSKR